MPTNAIRRFLYMLACAATSHAQSSGIRTYCNPIDVDYKYNFEQLFVVPDKWPFEDVCAPAALSVGDGIYIFQSTFEQRPILYTSSPDTGHLEFFNRLMPIMPGASGPWDPDIFRDPDTGRWFMYFGSSNVFPIYGTELDPNKRLTYIGKAKPLLALDPAQHGIDLEHEYDVKAVQVNYTDYKSNLFASDKTVYTQFRMYASTTQRAGRRSPTSPARSGIGLTRTSNFHGHSKRATSSTSMFTSRRRISRSATSASSATVLARRPRRRAI